VYGSQGFGTISALIQMATELGRKKCTQGRLWPPASGLHELQKGIVSLLFYSLTIELIYVKSYDGIKS
jgi:hypothetical protein